MLHWEWGHLTAFAYNTDNPNAMVYYLSGTTGWGVKYGGLWNRRYVLNTPQIGGNRTAMRTDGEWIRLHHYRRL